MRQDIDLTNFTAGELSPRAKGRIDQTKFFNGCDTLLNMVPMPLGGATKRPGTLFVALAKDQNPGLFRTRLMPFVFSSGAAGQSYVHEHSNQNVRVYMNDGVVLNAGVPVDVATPYLAADLPQLSYTQSADTFYLDAPTYPPATLTRTSHTSWTYAATQYRDGPYLPVNTTSTALTPGGTSGATTLTANQANAINGGQGFLASDVGRSVRILQGTPARWAWGTITSFTDNLHVGFTFGAAVPGGADGSISAASQTITWQLGKWSATTGYPYVPGFWQQRLFHCGTNNQPNAIEGSVSADFTNMAPTDDTGTVQATNALSWVISDDQVNAIRWISASGSAANAQLGIGTSGGEDVMTSGSISQSLSATSVQTYRETTYGSAPNAGNASGGPVRPLRIGKALMFVDRSARKLREWTFQYFINGYVGPDLSVWSEHITRGAPGTPPAAWGIREIVYQQAPHQVIWAVLNNGQLVSFTYDGPITGGAYAGSQLIFAPARHYLGGQYYGGWPIVESIAIIPSQDGTYDELWLCVLRTIAGVPTRTIEVMSRYFEAQAADQAVFLDCATQSALTFPAATVTPTGFTENITPGILPQTQPPNFTGTGTLTANANVFSAGNVNAVVRMNGGSLTVTGYTDPQHVMAQVITPLLNQAPAAANAWSMTPLATSFSGVSYLNGEEAAAWGDGAAYAPQVVAGGAFNISGAGRASFATVGLPYGPVLVTMPFEPQRAAAAGASQGKVKNIEGLWLRVHEASDFDFGVRASDDWTKTLTDRTEPYQSRSASDPMGQPPALFSGIRELRPQGAWDREGQLIITQETPGPLTVLSLFAAAEIGELSDAA